MNFKEPTIAKTFLDELGYLFKYSDGTGISRLALLDYAFKNKSKEDRESIMNDIRNIHYYDNILLFGFQRLATKYYLNNINLLENPSIDTCKLMLILYIDSCMTEKRKGYSKSSLMNNISELISIWTSKFNYSNVLYNFIYDFINTYYGDKEARKFKETYMSKKLRGNK